MFVNLLNNINNETTREEALEELADLRAEIAISHAIRPFNMDIDDVVRLLKNTDDSNLSDYEKEEKDRVLKAVENLIEFATCAEYQLMREAEEYDPDFDFSVEQINPDEEGNDDMMAPYWAMCRRYNSKQMLAEDDDAEYAMAMCYKWLHYSETQVLTYMTQEDDRVRPWHYALQGFSAPKNDFPSWMIPPIEWGCRCFLMAESGDIVAKHHLRNVKASTVPTKPEQLDDIFSESICTGGRIFGESHPYFQVDEADKEMLIRISDNIKSKYYGR